eukprot:213604-Chlamydomonas_euryale.AAC.12
MSEYPRDVDAIAEDFAQRRAGLLKALTEDSMRASPLTCAILRPPAKKQTWTSSSNNATLSGTTCVCTVRMKGIELLGKWRQRGDCSCCTLPCGVW